MKQLDLFAIPAPVTIAETVTTEPTGLRWLLNVRQDQAQAFIARLSFPATVGEPVGIGGRKPGKGVVGLWCWAGDYAKVATVRGRNSQDFRSVHCALGL